ncbi:cell division cycle-associated protein 3 [Brienomyrus brachyistius]|uniref:cell division cycle-associated protein 3 n=1 Tax=Brienomyrus brachyistius TaxID=42636 RepID=UPI0020B1C3EC|nr:cell division cycle-associated protein 3 [Brienomyrus brachyistius]
MGASNSKTTVTPSKPEPSGRVRNERVCRLFDPRSPTTGIDRTPIQVGVASQGPVEVACERPAPMSDPRSPSPGISRTPMKEVVRATVRSFTRRIGMLLLNDGEEGVKLPPSHTIPKLKDLTGDVEGEMDSTELLLPLNPSLDPITSPNSDSDIEVEMGIEANQFLENEVDDSPPLDVKLSSSLLTCHEGVVSSLSLAGDLHLSCNPPLDPDTLNDLVAEDAQSVFPEGTRPSSPEPSIHSAPLVNSEAETSTCTAECQPETEVPCCPSPASQIQPPQNQPASGENRIRLPTFNTQSPSQVVFKPQWLGVGFGVAGVRARGLQGRGRSGASPLSLRNGQNTGSENRGQMTKQKQRERCGKVLGVEGRSPLQILKENNPPRDHASQMKVKMTTPDRARRILSVDKENQ